jgi:hypothetical protein
MEKSPLLAPDAIDRAIGSLFIGLSVQRHPDRKSARRRVPDDLNGANGLAPGPLSDGLQALLSQSAVAQSDCLRPRHFTAVKVSRLAFISRQTRRLFNICQNKNRSVLPGGFACDRISRTG